MPRGQHPRVQMRIPIEQYLNKRYGRLVIIGEGHFKEGKPHVRSGYPHLMHCSKTRYVKCKCDCGTIKEIGLSSIKAGTIISCGCYGKSGLSYKSMLGKRYGKLVCIQEDRTSYCTVRCDCGNEFKTSRSGLPVMKSCSKCRGKKNYVGKIFGRLIVTEDNDTDYIKASYRYVKCKCDCGNENVIVRLNNLQSSIGHGTIPRCDKCGNNKDYSSYIGKRYGRLLITGCSRQKFKHASNKTKQTFPVFVCDCDCGIKGYTSNVHHIIRGNTTSCGCKRTEVYKENSLKIHTNMIGKKFFKLTIIGEEYETSKYVNNKGRVRYYICKCDCGNECRVLSSNIMQGKQKSCGCLRKGMSKIAVDSRAIKKYLLYNK